MNNFESSVGNEVDSEEKNSWDNLEEVPFNDGTSNAETDNNPESDVAIDPMVLGFVNQLYGDQIDTIISNNLCEGDDHSDPDNYVILMSIMDVCDEEAQRKLIQSCANGTPCDKESADKFKAGIAKMVAESGYAGELVNDPFLRQSHADDILHKRAQVFESLDSLQYQDEKDKASIDLENLLWGADPGFYESDEAKNLLANPSYIRSTYNLDQKVGEQMEGYYEDFSRMLGYMCESGETSIKELIEDPFLRRKHFDSLLEIETTGKAVEAGTGYLWQCDSNFYDSSEYSSCLYSYIKKNADIYEKGDQEELDNTINEVLNEIPDKKIEKILHIYEKGKTKVADKKLMKMLAPYLGLGRDVPKIGYVDKSDNNQGYYSSKNHMIVLCEDLINRVGSKNDQPILRTDQAPERSALKPLENTQYCRINTIAHELWHAHQYRGKNVDINKRVKYQQNSIYYASTKNGYYAYRSQLLEREAFAFGDAFEQHCRDLAEGDK